MQVRPFDWRDLPTLHRIRHQSVFLDSALVLTRGPMLVSGALLSTIAPRLGLFTGVSVEKDGRIPAIIGQVIHQPGSQFAHLTFITPDGHLDASRLSALLEYFILHTSERGALRMLAEIDEQKLAFEALHDDNFAIYARQRIWETTSRTKEKIEPVTWRTASDQDVIPIRTFYNNIVPGLVQQVEPSNSKRSKGMVYTRRDELLAYVELKYGHRGIWIQPFVHPDLEIVSDLFVKLFEGIRNRSSRPLYICVRSYQSWLEPVLEELGAKASSRQAVMVRHMAVNQKALQPVSISTIERRSPEITTPISNVESNH